MVYMMNIYIYIYTYRSIDVYCIIHLSHAVLMEARSLRRASCRLWDPAFYKTTYTLDDTNPVLVLRVRSPTRYLHDKDPNLSWFASSAVCGRRCVAFRG